MNYPAPRGPMMGVGIFAPYKVRVDKPMPFGDVIHEGYTDLDATWLDIGAAITSYWAVIEIPQGGFELVKVTVPVTGDERRDVFNALNGAFPGWKPVPVRSMEMMEAPF